MTADGAREAFADCSPAWAARAGHVEPVGAQPIPEDAAELANRYALIETVQRYAYAYDERSLSALRELFTESVVFSYTVSGGPIGEVRGRDAVIGWLDEIMASQADQRRHIVSNIVTQHLGYESATLVAYLALFSVAATAQLVTTGFYRFELLRQDDRWKISAVLDGLDRPF